MKVLKASAGSGKTYRLAHEYLDILLSSEDRYAYRHILAVTFTNKATAEMKGRILRDLAKEAEKNPKARRILSDILHDYSAFAVTTIDKFFQQALKAFSREIGQSADYQIELDRDSLVEETMDRILDSLTEDSTEIIEWLKSCVSDSLENGSKVNIENALYETGARLKNEEHRELAERLGISDRELYSKKNLSALRNACRKIIGDFTARASALGIKSRPGEKIAMPLKKVFKAGGAPMAELFDAPYRLYCTAWILNSQIYSLGLAGEFYKEFDALMKEKNVMCLDESNKILRDIIDGSDAPFVYEKMGVRYENFLLDEFQDTSNIQWENFLPLLRESESKGGRNLIVGDVKQSIYRWRDSDWNLLGSKVAQEFPEADTEVLGANWRSCSEIVKFNNSLFRFAAGKVGLSTVYSDVAQTVRSSDPQRGFVKVSFTDDQDRAVVTSIRAARDAGAGWGDIAVLVRNRQEGAVLSSVLVGEGIPVISDDSLSLKSSLLVRRLVSLLSLSANPSDEIGGYLARSLGVVPPQEYHSLCDLAENLLRELTADSGIPQGEAMFLQAFMDELRSWTDLSGSDLPGFLSHWAESDFYIGMPETSSAVRVLTVHKSKGLEFPYLIFPYAEKVGMYKAGVHWCRIDGAAPGANPSEQDFRNAADGIYPVELTSSSENTLFCDDYQKEKQLQLVDNLNVFYVAMTRARCCLHVIAKQPSKKCRESISKGAPQYGNFSEILFDHIGSLDEAVFGEMYDFRRLPREDSGSQSPFDGRFVSYGLGGRLTASESAAGYFGEDGIAGVAASPRLAGVALHDILSEVNRPGDIPGAVRECILKGGITQEQGEECGRLLSERIASHPEWFADGTQSGGAVVRNEHTVFGPDGSQWRPDRVVLFPDRTVILDYKFGEESPSYIRQVERYVDLYRRMGYPDVSGAIWYVRDDKVVRVS